MLTVGSLHAILAAALDREQVATVARIIELAPLAPDVPLGPVDVAKVVLACLATGAPDDDAARRLVAFTSAVGDPLGPVLLVAIDRVRHGLPVWPSADIPTLLRYHRAPGSEFVALDMRRTGGTAMAVVFVPEHQQQPSPSALQIAAEVSLPWLMVEHLADALGHDAPDDESEPAVTGQTRLVAQAAN